MIFSCSNRGFAEVLAMSLCNIWQIFVNILYIFGIYFSTVLCFAGILLAPECYIGGACFGVYFVVCVAMVRSQRVSKLSNFRGFLRVIYILCLPEANWHVQSEILLFSDSPGVD